MFEDNDNIDGQDNMDAWRDLTVFQKAESVLKLVEHILDGIPKEESGARTTYEFALFEHHARNMMENALQIPAKIAGAEGVEIYDHKMENATIIRKAAREIILDTRGLQMAGFKQVEYLDLLRREIEAFRPVFAEWVKTFNSSHYVIDRWGLFNPPGVNYNDEDTDDLF